MSRPSSTEAQGPLDQYYRVSPVPHALVVRLSALDPERIADYCDEHTEPHMAYWFLWFLHLSRKEEHWVGASWAMCDREVFIACPGVSRFDWLLWQGIRCCVYVCTLGRYCPVPLEVDELSRLRLRRAFWILVDRHMLERQVKTFDDNLMMEVFYPTSEFAMALSTASYNPEQN